MTDYNDKDHKIWNDIFLNPPTEWKEAPEIPLIEDCRQFFKKHEVSYVLDVGCGPGYWGNSLAKSGFVIRGLDFSKAAVDYANAWAEECGHDAKFKCSSATENPFPEQEFDAALAVLILDNISREEAKNSVNMISSSLKKDGIVYVMFNPIMTDELREFIEKSNNPTKGATSIDYSEEEIKDLFSGAGFSLSESKLFDMGMRVYFASKK